MQDDNIRGNVGGIAGEVLEDCEACRIYYFIRRESALRIQRNWRIYLNQNAQKTECCICLKQYKFMSINYYCLHKLCSQCNKAWNGNCPECRAKELSNKIIRR